ncbi:MAG: hypothetical protein AAF590_02970 [Pseudomonadota bacterium]
MTLGKRFDGKEMLAEHSLATVKSFDAASVPFNSAAARWGVVVQWGVLARRAAWQILEDQRAVGPQGQSQGLWVSCGLRLVGAPMRSHQNALMIEYGP